MAVILNNWCDALLLGIEWPHDGKHLILTVHLASGEKPRWQFRATWAAALRMEVEMRSDHARPLLLWEARKEELEGGRLRVQLDFAGDGMISFECHALEELNAPV